jgi:hypothetical protein
MHTVPAFHVVGSLALAICTNSTNDRADFGFLQFKAAQLLRLAENNGSKTLGNTWYVFYPIVKLHSPCDRIPWVLSSCLDFCNFRRGLKILMPRLVSGSGVVKPLLREAACRAASSATAFRPIPTLATQRTPTTNQKIREAGRFSFTDV